MVIESTSRNLISNKSDSIDGAKTIHVEAECADDRFDIMELSKFGDEEGEGGNGCYLVAQIALATSFSINWSRRTKEGIHTWSAQYPRKAAAIVASFAGSTHRESARRLKVLDERFGRVAYSMRRRL